MRKNPVKCLFFINGGTLQKMLQLDSSRVCKSTTLNTLKKEVFISQNSKVPVITDQDVYILLLA